MPKEVISPEEYQEEEQEREEEDERLHRLAQLSLKKKKSIFDAVMIGRLLHEEAEETGNIAFFIPPLIIAVAKDLTDIFGVTAPSMLTGLVATLILLAFLWGTKMWEIKIIQICAGLLNSIPLVAFVPWQTLAVIHAYFFLQKKRAEKMEEAETLLEGAEVEGQRLRMLESNIRSRKRSRREGSPQTNKQSSSQTIHTQGQTPRQSSNQMLARAMLTQLKNFQTARQEDEGEEEQPALSQPRPKQTPSPKKIPLEILKDIPIKDIFKNIKKAA